VLVFDHQTATGSRAVVARGVLIDLGEAVALVAVFHADLVLVVMRGGETPLVV
jgi:hypothetical protein